MENLDYWIINADSFLHQILMIVMASLYEFAWILGVSYKAVNIYVYLILFPFSFSLLIKGWKKFLFIPFSLLFFLYPGFEKASVRLFNSCVNFLTYLAEYFNSDYITISVYLCVFVPVSFYIPLLIIKMSQRQLIYVLKSTFIVSVTYIILVYPNFKLLL
jgi:hypothetical protein